jgi:hypothetical protein
VVVEFHFYNGFCKIANRNSCPSIDGYIEFKKQSDGTWAKTNIGRDGYPSLAIYQQQSNGTFSEEFRDPEGHWRALKTSGETNKQWRQQMQLPPGCQLQ